MNKPVEAPFAESTAIVGAIRDFQGDLVAIRRDLHAHPELGYEEVRTAAIVEAQLLALGIETPDSAADLTIEQGAVYVFGDGGLAKYC